MLVLWVIPQHNDIDFALFQEPKVLPSQVMVFSQDDSGLRVSGNVLARLEVVRGVHSDGQAPGEQTSVVGEGPLWSVEPDDVDRRVLWELEADEGLGETESLIVVLLEVNCLLH